MKLFKTLSLAAAAALLMAGAAHAQIKLRYAHVGVANAPQTLYADEVAKLVKERTNGRVEIQVFANSQLGGVGEMVDGIKSGAIDPFTGPVVDNAGKERLPKGEKASQEWKDKVDFYVKGVEGKVPSGK